jgi:hypothetical protein
VPALRHTPDIRWLLATAALVFLNAPTASAVTILRWLQPADSAPVEEFVIYKGPAPYSGELVETVLPEPDASGVYAAGIQIDEIDQGIGVFVWLTAANDLGESAPSNTKFYPPGCDHALDTDCDGIPDDGAPGDVPCADAQALGCDDNCPWWPNPGQDDTGGIGTGSPPDGIGDECQCGDVSGDGRVSNADSIIIQRSLLVPPTATMARPDLCDVGGSVGCSNGDSVIIGRAQLTPPTATVQQHCDPALVP